MRLETGVVDSGTIDGKSSRSVTLDNVAVVVAREVEIVCAVEERVLGVVDWPP